MPTGQHDEVVPVLPRGTVRLTVCCNRCGYNLKGVEAAGKCPECGSPVWPSVRPLVDSNDERFTLLKGPRCIAASLIIVTACLLCSAVLLWVPYLAAAIRQIRSPSAPLMAEATVGHFVLVGLLAGLALAATFGLHAPTGAAPSAEYRRGLGRARIGLLAWAVLHVVLLVFDANVPRSANEWSDFAQVHAARSIIRLGLDLAALAMIVGFQPVVRFLSVRSAPHRVGGASRQGFLALYVAILTVLCGDLLSLGGRAWEEAGGSGPLLDNLGITAAMLILIGSAMTTLALLNLTVDSIRLASSLARPRYHLEEIIG